MTSLPIVAIIGASAVIATPLWGGYLPAAMSIKRVTPDEAASLLGQGWIYVDVRSVPEFEQGHPQGAYNVPFLHRAAHGMVPNPDFAAVMEAAFPKDARLVMGCRTGGRSLQAAEALVARGYQNIIDMRGGLAGELDEANRITCEGWQARGLPVTRTAQSGRTYNDLKPRSRG
jgi:rhodanese-related sulfurtransferase